MRATVVVMMVVAVDVMMVRNNLRWRRWCYCMASRVAECRGQTWARRRRKLSDRFRSLVIQAVENISIVKRV